MNQTSLMKELPILRYAAFLGLLPLYLNLNFSKFRFMKLQPTICDYLSKEGMFVSTYHFESLSLLKPLELRISPKDCIQDKNQLLSTLKKHVAIQKSHLLF
jgi:hypothetical protein